MSMRKAIDENSLKFPSSLKVCQSPRKLKHTFISYIAEQPIKILKYSEMLYRFWKYIQREHNEKNSICQTVLKLISSI